jgi:hypothetical protein
MTLRPLIRTARWALPAAVAATAILLAGCGGGGGDDTTTARGSVEDQIGFTQDGISERQSRVEAAIRDCMKSQGFEYVPVDPLAQRAAITGSSRLSDEDFTRQFGYGISTLYGRGSPQSDPNDQIRSGLGAADRAAYERALYGENTGVTFAQAVDTGDFTRLGGCTKQATETVFGGAQVLTALQGKLDDLDQQIAEDQRMVRATEQWTACMARAGFRYSEPDDIDGQILDRFKAIVGASAEAGATGPPTPGTTANQAALTALQRTEVATAVADLDCEKRYITPVEDVVRPQYEARFREQNGGLIARLKPVGG